VKIIKKIGINLVNYIRKIYWFTFRPTTIGVRLLNVHDNEILLVRHTYSNYWYLPGGGAKKRVGIIDSLKKEIKDELTVALNEDQLNNINLLGIYNNFQEYKNDYIFLFILENERLILSDTKSIEIEEAKYFSLDALPSNISPGTKRRIDDSLSRRNKVIIDKW